MTPSQLFYEGKLENKPNKIANIMNKFFIDKVKKIRESITKHQNDPLFTLKKLMRNRNSQFSLQYVYPDTVNKIISSLKNSKSCGMDYIDTYTIKLIKPIILPALTHIINLSIKQSEFPDLWKIAKIVPLHKKDDILNPKNYRPLAVLPVASKILERVIFLQVVDCGVHGE